MRLGRGRRDADIGARSARLADAPLRERRRELAAIDALIATTAAGRAGSALVEGPAGIGKTRLIAVARERAREAGLRVYPARGGELEREFSFGVVRQLFERSVAADPELLAGAADAAAGVFALGQAEAADPSFASLHGLYWLAVNLSAGGPLLLAVDDVHWCDRASLRFLGYLLHRLEGLPIALACGLRTSEQPADAGLIGEIVADPLTVTIRPRPLSPHAVTEALGERLGGVAEPAFAAACHTATGGNPLLLGELLKALQSDGVAPDDNNVEVVARLGKRAVARTVLLRLARLPADAVAVAEALAVLGDGADLAAVGALSGLDDARASAGAAALVAAEILHAEPPLGFVHPIVGAAVLEDIPPGERALRHERAAWLLAAAGAATERVAAHLLASPARGEARVVEQLRAAAATALRRGAADGAVTYLARALAEPPPAADRADVLLELGRTETMTNGPAAAEHLAAAYELLRDPLARATTAQLLARALLFTGRPAEGAAVARAAAAELPARLVDQRDALEAFELLSVLFGSGDVQALQRLERRRSQPVGDGVGAKMLAAITAQDWVYACGPSDACSALSLAALTGGELVAADNGLLATVAITNLVFADREEAVTWWEASRADAHRRGSLFAISSLSLWWGFTLYWRGDLAEAEASLRTALDEFDLWGYGEEQAAIYCNAFLSGALLERGDLAGARRALTASADPGGDDDGARYWCKSNFDLLIAEGRDDLAMAALDDYERRFAGIVRNPMDAPWRSAKATLLARRGRHEEARSLIEEELELARAWGAPGTVARSLRALGTLGRDAGLDHLEEAVAVVEGSPARLEHAKALAALGAAQRRARRPTKARAALREAHELAEQCGAAGLAAHARTELYAAGGRTRTKALTGVASLTASERRVAALVAEGQTNREVAQALFVTPKTVELHLSNVYRKLGIESRRELPQLI